MGAQYSCFFLELAKTVPLVFAVVFLILLIDSKTTIFCLDEVDIFLLILLIDVLSLYGRTVFLCVVENMMRSRFADLFHKQSEDIPGKHVAIRLQEWHFESFLNSKMLNKAKFVHRISSMQYFQYDKNSFDVVDLVWDFLLYDIVNLLTRTIWDSSADEGLIDLGDTIHAVVIVKASKYIELFVVVDFIQHFRKQLLVLAPVFCMN